MADRHVGVSHDVRTFFWLIYFTELVTECPTFVDYTITLPRPQMRGSHTEPDGSSSHPPIGFSSVEFSVSAFYLSSGFSPIKFFDKISYNGVASTLGRTELRHSCIVSFPTRA